MAIYVTDDTRIAFDELVTVTDPLYDPDLDARAVIAYEDRQSGATVLANAGIIQGTLEIPGEISGIIVSRYSGTGSGYFVNEETGIVEITSLGYIEPDFAWQYWARGYYAPQQATDVYNDGVIDVYSYYTSAVGIEVWGYGGEWIENTGEILVDAGADAYGIKFENGDSVFNSGSIEAYGLEMAYGVWIGHYAGEGFENTGSIVARTDAASPWASVGFGFFSINDGYHWQPNIIRNSGTIDAEIAILAYDGNGAGSTIATSEVVLNSGLLAGDVLLAYGDDSVVNSGNITGFTGLGQGDDFFDGRRGRQAAVSGGNGDDVLIGGSRDDYLLGDAGADQLNGGAGDDYLVGGSGGDGIDGGAGFDLVDYLDSTQRIVADLAAGTIDAAARDLVRNVEAVTGSLFGDSIAGASVAELLDGAAGDDTIAGGAGADTLVGEGGDDELAGGSGADILRFSLGDGADRVLDFTPGIDQLEIFGYAAGEATISQSGSDTLIEFGDGGDRILLQGVSAAALLDGDLVFDAANVLVPATPLLPVTLVLNEDLVIGYDEYLLLIDPLPVQFGDQFFENTGIAIESFRESPGIWNEGIVELVVSASDATAWGIVSSIPDGAWWGQRTIVNAQTGVLAVSAEGGGDAVGIDIHDGLWNAGLIDIASSAGNAWGVLNGTPEARIVNSGDLYITAAGFATGIVSIESVWNSGTIDALGGAGAIGLEVDAEQTRDVIVNSGTIRVADETAARDSVALHVSSFVLDYTSGVYVNARIWNSGTLAGDYAIRGFSDIQPDPHTGFTVYNSGLLDGFVELGSGADIVRNTGSIAGNVLLLAGNDRYDGRLGTLDGLLDGGDGNDLLYTGAGAQSLRGGRGADVLAGGAGNDTLRGGAGNDVFHVEPGSGADIVSDFTAGGTQDRIRVAGFSAYESIEQQGTDTLVRFSATDSILLLGVQAASLGAADFEFGANSLPAPAGLPTAPRAPTAPAAPGAPAVDVIALIGSGIADTLDGGSGHDIIHGLAGNDELHGRNGGDEVRGGEGGDRLFGETGADTLDGGSGRDLLRGGAGADRFRFDEGDFAGTGTLGTDVILDFSQADGDRIDLSAVDASRQFAYDDAFTFIGTASFGGTRGELRYTVSDATTWVAGDIDGDRAADFWIRLEGAHALQAADFIL